MYIKSLDIDVLETKIITDIDNCLFLSSKSIRDSKLSKRVFWFDEKIYESNKYEIFNRATLTDWGKEFIEIVSKGFIDYKLLTAGKNRIDILEKKLGVKTENIIEGILDEEKVNYLNSIETNCIYVDDKLSVIKKITNAKVVPINFPKKVHIQTRRRNNYSRRFN